MENSEKLEKLEKAVGKMVNCGRKVNYTTEMLQDLQDGEEASVEITCKGRSFILYRVEWAMIYNCVKSIIEIGLEKAKTDYEEANRELAKTWKEVRG